MNLYELTIAEASELIRKKSISPLELTRSCLARIDTFNDELRAFITVYNEDALALARTQEAKLSTEDDLAPLFGIPIGLKDNIALKDKITTAGSKILKDWVPQNSATVGKRLADNGAIFIGKTNLHEFAWGGTSYNPHYGFVRNPWDTSKFAAGSSGGSGAAVAAGMCLGALGTDTGGSIRLPSSVSGLVGIRPTYGRVSNYGIIPLAWSMDTAGPMTHTVADCELIFDAIAGPDILDPNCSEKVIAKARRNEELDVSGLQVGIIRDYSLSHIQNAVRRTMESTIREMEAMGIGVREVEISNISNNMAAVLTVESAEPSAYHERWLTQCPESYGTDVRQLLQLGRMLSATEYIHAQRYRRVLRDEFLKAFETVDFILCPTLPFVTPKIGTTKVAIENNVEEDMLSAIMQFTGLASLTGLPALSVPAGFDETGMPIGVQLIGNAFGESVLFRVGRAFQSGTKFHEKRPALEGQTKDYELTKGK